MFRYIDLFCGIGGFHQGIDRVSKEKNFEAQCVFAADNDQNVSDIYEKNYGISCFYDLTSETTHQLIDDAIGEGELNCIFGGFPCQPFSKAGNQEGFSNKMKGTLFFEIEKIIHRHHPQFLLLENVKNLERHDNGNTWNIIKTALEAEGYLIDETIISPNNIKNIPALRERFFIMAYNKEKLGISDIEKIGRNFKKYKTSIYTRGKKDKGLRKEYFVNYGESDLEYDSFKTIEMWNELHRELVNNGRKIISPLWPHYFDDQIDLSEIPDWKIKIIKRNQKFYIENKDIYDAWYQNNKEHFDSLCESDKKFEWNAGDTIESAWDGIIQFRPSGVRVKRPDFIPTLVAINQNPILGCQKRYLKPEEMAKIYGFKKLEFGDQTESESKKQLGNTVSVDVVEYLINHMFRVAKWEV